MRGGREGGGAVGQGVAAVDCQVGHSGRLTGGELQLTQLTPASTIAWLHTNKEGIVAGSFVDVPNSYLLIHGSNSSLLECSPPRRGGPRSIPCRDTSVSRPLI